MNTYVLCLQEIDRTKFMVAGGKGAISEKHVCNLPTLRVKIPGNKMVTAL